MKFTKTVNIWNLTQVQIRALKPGQWVDAGGARGRFWGVKPSGTVVVAWHQNAKNSGNYDSYNKSLMNYARAA